MFISIAGLSGAALSCADAKGADRAQAAIAAISMDVFILAFPSILNGLRDRRLAAA
jgi:hypothetical protein